MRSKLSLSKRWAAILVLQAIALSPAAFARDGGATGVGGGGDLCESRIQFVRDEIKEWIVKGGPKGLKLPQGTTVKKYSLGMLEAIKAAKIRCVGKGDPGFPVLVNGTPKICRFEKNVKTGASRITCDFAKFQSVAESEQYVLIHHEYAGIAKMENPEGDISTYSISNQITGYLVDQVVKRLSVSLKDTSTVLLRESESCRNTISQYEASIYGFQDKKLSIGQKQELHELLDKALESCMRPLSPSQKLILFQAASASSPGFEGLLVFLKVNQGKTISLREIQEEKSLGVSYNGNAFELLPDTKACNDAFAKFDAAPGSIDSSPEKNDLATELLLDCTQKMSQWAQDILIDSQFWEATGYNRAGLIRYIKKSRGKIIPITEIANTHTYPAI